MRARFISAAISVLFCILIAGLWYTQVIKYKKYLVLSRTNRVRLLSIESQRGKILDRNGVLLVDNSLCFDVAVIPQELENSADTLQRLGGLLGIAPQDVWKTVEKNYIAPFAPIIIKEDIQKPKAIALEESVLPGIIVKVRPKREYRFNEVGSHVFGYLGEIGRGELERLKGYGYQIKDLVGKAGIEKSYDIYLRGEQGGMQLEVNNKGYLIKPLGKKEAQRGKDIYLAIDIRLQAFIENLFAEKLGACVVMNPYTGEVLALVSKPDFNPNFFVARERQLEVAAFLNQPDRPMLNRAVSGLYPPGSVFKPVVAVAALEEKKVDPTTTFSCSGKYNLGGSVFRCWDEDGHGVQDINQGLKNSCNALFYQVGRIVGVDDIALFATKFGFGAPTGIDVTEEAAGLVPNRLWKKLSRKEAWFEGDTVNFAIGQGYLLVTPIQVVRMMSAIANGGRLVQPYIVKRIEGVEITAGRSQNVGVSKSTLDEVRAGLEMVVNDETGTGRRARAPGLRIAGKTGTAQNPKGASHAWFSGFSPVDGPKIALVVFVENGGKGGLDAAEFSGKIFQEAANLGLL